MNRRIRSVLLWLAMACGPLALQPSSLYAQSAAAGHWEYDPAGIATPAFIYDTLPTAFNPLTATDSELDQYGLPPRPKTDDVAHLARWQRQVIAARVTPTVEFTKLYAGPVAGRRISGGTATSFNWSGYVDFNVSTPPFINSGSLAAGNWVVPEVTQGTCSSTTSYLLQWVGMDGWEDSADVLQAGSMETSTNCESGSSDYTTWYEWYPNSITKISTGMRVLDDLEVEVWYTSTSPHGHAWYDDQTRSTYTTIGFNPPSGTTFVGNSLEWIVERPTESGSLSNLADYGTQSITNADGEDGIGGTVAPESSNSSYAITFQPVSMVCPPWNPSSSCSVSNTVISQVGAVTDTYDFTTQAEPPAAP
jgi:hypothetical protein